jgi:hypothetical protein
MKRLLSVILAKNGIKPFHKPENPLDPGFHRSGDFFDIIKIYDKGSFLCVLCDLCGKN